MASGSEWLAIVEMQQQELQELRALVTTPERWSDDARSAFAPSPARSSTSSSSSSCCCSRSGDGDVLPLDLQRYANVCGDLEATRQGLVLKDAKYRELRARANQMKREIDECRQNLKDSNAQVDALTVQFAHEQSAKQEAVDRAALAMVQSEELALRLHDATRETERLRAESRLQSERTHQLVRRHSETHKETVSSRATIARLEEAVRVAKKEKNALLKQLQFERERHTQHVCVSTDEAELRRRVEEHERVLSLQTAQLEQQQHAIVELHSARTALEEQVLTERSQHQCNVTQQLHANIALQQVADESVSQVRLLNVALAEREEQLQMQDEDIAAYAAWKRMARQRELQREAVCSDTHETREKMERAVRFAEASRRKAIMELAEAKRQLAQLQTAMVGVDTELQRMNKTFVVFRTRCVHCRYNGYDIALTMLIVDYEYIPSEANVSRTLREYGRRNRLLLDAVRLMSSKVPT
jgi:DNA repair exonuclease SbcCD ATPase subunit